MTAVSKAFNYIVSTTQEDQMVGKSLAGCDQETTSRLPTLAKFDAVVLRRTRLLQVKLFNASQGFADSLSLRDDVVDVLTATAILHYPEMLLHSPESPYIKRVRQALSQVQATEAEIAAWAIVIHRTLKQPEKNAPRSPTPRRTGNDELLRRQTLLLEQQAQLLGGLAADVKELNQRVGRLENPSREDSTQPPPGAAGQSIPPSDAARATPGRAHSRAKPLASVWYEWFLPALPNARQNHRRHHECKVAVSFMRIFLPMGYDVTGEESDAKGRILSSGREAEANILAFLEAKNIKAKSHGTIVK
ncbi:hypothetical protein PR003_g31342, partial [Phytophthora rubi]